jgi:hypothetical protein
MQPHPQPLPLKKGEGRQWIELVGALFFILRREILLLLQPIVVEIRTSRSATLLEKVEGWQWMELVGALFLNLRRAILMLLRPIVVEILLLFLSKSKRL